MPSIISTNPLNVRVMPIIDAQPLTAASVKSARYSTYIRYRNPLADSRPPR
ncbi:hypothetical protein D3C85_1903020 [compost metagenome]